MRVGDVVDTDIGWARAGAGLGVLPPLLVDVRVVVVLSEEGSVVGLVTEDELRDSLRRTGIPDALHPSVLGVLPRAAPWVGVTEIMRGDVVVLPGRAPATEAARALLRTGDGFVVALDDDGAVMGAATRAQVVAAVSGRRHTHVRRAG